MATRTYLHSLRASWHRGNNDAKRNGSTSGWIPLPTSTVRGSGVTSDATNTAAGPTSGVEVQPGSAAFEWLTHPVDADVTISGTITANIWAHESSMNANAAINFEVWKVAATDLALTLIARSTRVVELGTASAVQNFTVTPTSTALNKGDRLRIVIFADDATGVNMASGFTFTVSYNGTTAAASGDTYIEFNETFGFQTTDPTGTSVWPTNDAASGGLSTSDTDYEAWTSRGSGPAIAASTSLAGWAAPKQAEAGGASPISWFTRPLEAFTLSGLVKCNIWAREVTSAVNGSFGIQIARVDQDGSNPVVWGYANKDATQNGGNGEVTSGSAVAYTVYVSGDDLSISNGQRIRIRYYLDDCADIPISNTDSMWPYFDGPTGGALGDSFITFGQTLTEFTGTQTVVMQKIGATGTLFNPKVTQKVQLQTISLPTVVSSPKVVQVVKTQLISLPTVVRNPTVVPGAVTVVMNKIGPTSTVFTQTVAQVVRMNAIGPTNILFNPKVIQTVKTQLIGPTGTLFSPKITQTVKTNLISLPTVVSAPKVVSTVKIPLIALPTNVFQPNVLGAQTVVMNKIGPTNALFGPKVTQTVKTNLISLPTIVFNPSVRATNAVVLQKIGPTNALFNPRVQATNIVALQKIGPTNALFSPKVVSTVKMQLIGPTGTLFNPKVTRTVKTLTIAPATIVRNPTVLPGGVNVVLQKIGPTSNLFEHRISTGGSLVTMQKIGPTGLLHNLTVVPGAVTVSMQKIGPTDVLFQPRVIPAQFVSIQKIGPTSVSFNPQVTQTIKLNKIGPSTQIFEPSIEQLVQLQRIVLPTVVFQPAVQQQLLVRPDTLGPNTIVFAPAISGGYVIVSGSGSYTPFRFGGGIYDPDVHGSGSYDPSRFGDGSYHPEVEGSGSHTPTRVGSGRGTA